MSVRYSTLFDYNIGYLYNVKKVIGKIEKDPQVLMAEGYFLKPSIRWEQRIDNGYPNVFYDEAYKEYRCYYTCFIKDQASTEFRPEQRINLEYPLHRYPPRTAGILLTTSKDGIHWIRPSLGICEYEGSRDNNILLTNVHGASVFRDEHETDPARRYKMAMRHDAHKKVAVSFSTDGIHWCDPIDLPNYNAPGDTHNFAFWDDAIDRYVLITRLWAQGVIRVVARSESEDFINWSPPVEIYRGDGFDDQLYSMPVFKLRDVYYGLGSVYHGGDRASKDFDCVDCELLYSLDGLNWERAVRGESFIPRGMGRYGDDVPDCGCIYASIPVEQNGRYIFYYFGSNGQHTNFRESSLMCASINPNKLAGYAAKSSEGGYLGTCQVKITGDRLIVTADISDGGSLRAAVCRPGSLHSPINPIDGYQFENSIVEEHTDGEYHISFKTGKLSQLPEEPLIVVFHLDKTVLYGYDGDIEPIRRKK